MFTKLQRHLKLSVFSLFMLMMLQSLNAQNTKPIHIEGDIIESISQKPVEYANISIYNLEDKIITGGISNEAGHFELTSPIQNFYLKIEFIGFNSLFIREFQIQNGQVNLGKVLLEVKQKNLNEVTIRGEKSKIEFKTDKRVFNVGQDLISAGGSALDVLNNVPSVDVNIEGTISLRGNANVLILINGKPSVLTEGNALGTITADMIEKIELITNPSAKYDAEGTSGILNIILKKEDKKGTNGSLTINTGYPHNHSLGLSLNRRTENFNLFSQFGLGYRRFESSSNAHRINKASQDVSTLYTDGNGEKNEQFYNVVLGTDYHINAQNVFTLSGNLAYEIEDENALYNYRTVNSLSELFSEMNRSDLTEAVNPKMEYQLNYEKSFKGQKERKLSANATGSYFGKDKTSSFENELLLGEGQPAQQKTSTDFAQKSYQFMVDYIHPFSKTSKLEIGAKYELENLTNDYSLSDLEDHIWVISEVYTNTFEYNQNTAAAYSTYDHEWGNLGMKMGLRLENTDLYTFLENTNTSNQKNYTDLFPSLHTSYKLTELLSFQLGYSKRISRPSLWDVNPFFSLRDAYNIRTGNPDLLPEYTHAFEFTTVKLWEKASLSTAIFHRRTSDVMSHVVKLEEGLIISTSENIGNSYNTGLEINSKINPFKWMSLMLDAYYNVYQRVGSYEAQSFDFNSDAYSGRLSLKFKMPADFDLELRCRHRSEYKDVQSTFKAQTTLDMGLKKKIFNGRASIHLSVSDLFNSHVRASVTDLADFYQFSERSRDGRRIIIGFSYGFGKGEAMEYSGQKMF